MAVGLRMMTGTAITTRLWILALLLGSTAAMAKTSPSELHIRVLAASCAACHGTNGVSVSGRPNLAGMPAAQFQSRMMAFRTSKADHDVMTQHARGLTTDEIDRLAAYFSTLPVPK
ncbi:c-type cytochrome [Advenella mimigardefordensis]|uniref:c-type cytochrome n=1 Tax=Advenella mimigardefordensis TaxID=302406 RepID=UPI001C9DD0DA|nr:c-type cytochrome [Advenella mimigardefordensis]